MQKVPGNITEQIVNENRRFFLEQIDGTWYNFKVEKVIECFGDHTYHVTRATVDTGANRYFIISMMDHKVVFNGTKAGYNTWLEF